MSNAIEDLAELLEMAYAENARYCTESDHNLKRVTKLERDNEIQRRTIEEKEAQLRYLESLLCRTRTEISKEVNANSINEVDSSKRLWWIARNNFRLRSSKTEHDGYIISGQAPTISTSPFYVGTHWDGCRAKIEAEQFHNMYRQRLEPGQGPELVSVGEMRAVRTPLNSNL